MKTNIDIEEDHSLADPMKGLTHFILPGLPGREIPAVENFANTFMLERAWGNISVDTDSDSLDLGLDLSNFDRW